MLVAAASCGHSATTLVTSPSGTRCNASVTGAPASFGPRRRPGTLSVGVARECTWSAVSQSPWISFTSSAQGQGEGTVNYHVAANADPVARQGTIVVGEQQVAVAEEPAPCGFDVSGAADTVAAAGGQISIEVRTHTLCSWTAGSEVPGRRHSTAGRGNGTVSIAVTPNAGGTSHCRRSWRVST